MLLESALSFLGAGVQPPNSSWGSMISTAFDLISSAPLLTILPGTMILLTVLSLNVFGDGLRDALDPKSKVAGRGPRRDLRAGGDGGLMARFIVRRTDRDGRRPLRRLGDRLPDLQRDPELGSRRSGWRGKTPTPELVAIDQRRMGIRRIAARSSTDDDGEDLHRRTGLLREPAQRRRTDRQGDPGDLLALHRRRGALDVLRHPLRLPLGDQGRRARRTGCSPSWR